MTLALKGSIYMNYIQSLRILHIIINPIFQAKNI